MIKKKSVKWRLLQDLRKVNETMVVIGPLQPGLPSPKAIPKGAYKLIIDLKDCFYTISLAPQDCPRLLLASLLITFINP